MNVNELFERIPFPIKPRLPAFDGVTDWLNSGPLTPADLRGQVVIVDFWTYTCINWIRTLPYIRGWNETYGAHGLVVVGVHTPEFGIEHDADSVRRAARDMRVEYPVAIDNEYAVWNAFANRYWPALYVADADGRIRYKHFGEGAYDRSERVVRELLADAGAALPEGPAPVAVNGIEVPADSHDMRSPETYVGFARASGFASSTGVAIDEPRTYTQPPVLGLNEWALAGEWTVGREAAVANEANGRIAYRFHARDLNLILAPPSGRSPIRIRVLLDGQPPLDAHGLDVDEDGLGIVREPRLYQLIRQPAPIEDRLFEIEFIDPRVAAFCFTFG